MHDAISLLDRGLRNGAQEGRNDWPQDGRGTKKDDTPILQMALKVGLGVAFTFEDARPSNTRVMEA